MPIKSIVENEAALSVKLKTQISNVSYPKNSCVRICSQSNHTESTQLGFYCSHPCTDGFGLCSIFPNVTYRISKEQLQATNENDHTEEEAFQKQEHHWLWHLNIEFNIGRCRVRDLEHLSQTLTGSTRNTIHLLTTTYPKHFSTVVYAIVKTRFLTWGSL